MSGCYITYLKKKKLNTNNTIRNYNLIIVRMKNNFKIISLSQTYTIIITTILTDTSYIPINL